MTRNQWSMLTPSMIFHNGCVHTVDRNDSIVEALAISNKRIMATGSNEAILAMAADDTQRIDLGDEPGELWAMMLDTPAMFERVVRANAPSDEQAEATLLEAVEILDAAVGPDHGGGQQPDRRQRHPHRKRCGRFGR